MFGRHCTIAALEFRLQPVSQDGPQADSIVRVSAAESIWEVLYVAYTKPFHRFLCGVSAGRETPIPAIAWLVCLAALAGAAVQARAEDEVLKLVPEKALGFAIVNHPESADAKMQELGQQTEFRSRYPSLLAMLEGPGGIRQGL